MLRGARSEIPFSDAVEAAKDSPLLLSSLDELHFLDWHACALLAGSGVARAPAFVLRRPAPAHMRLRVAADFFDEFANGPTPYQRGAILARFLSLASWPELWHNYLTSRDARQQAPRRVLVGATLDSPFPHLRAGFLTGIDLFHAGEYYAAHEDLESLWIRLDDGPERRAAQGLIQLAGAHIHRLKGRTAQAKQLYRRARTHLTHAGPALAWLKLNELIASSDAAFAAANGAEFLPWPAIPMRNMDKRLPRKHS
ncbi:MAG: DUF309 domain-containing protein [Pyrinomonadaceae bacterium]